MAHRALIADKAVPATGKQFMDLVAAINLASIACNDLFSNLRAEGSMSIRCPTTAKFTLIVNARIAKQLKTLREE